MVVDPGLASEAGINVGDEVELATDAGLVIFEVVGIAASTGRAPYPIWDPAAVYVTPLAFDGIAVGSTHSPALAVRLADPYGARAVIVDVNSGSGGMLIRGQSGWESISAAIREEARLKVIVLSTFSVFALLAVGLIVANVVSGQALSQRREIGLLKAVGFTPLNATMLFAGQQLLLGMSGVAIGILIGIATTPYWLSGIADQLGQSANSSIAPIDVAFVGGGVLLLLLVFTLTPSWRAGRLATIEALRSTSDRPDRGASRTHSLASSLPLPRAAVTGLKDLFSRPVRAMMTIAAMAMAAATIMFTLTVDATVDGLAENPSTVGEGWYDVRADRLSARFVDPSEPDPEGAIGEREAAAIVRQGGVDGVVEARQFVVRANGETAWARMLEGDLESLQVRFTDGSWPTSGDEVVLGYGLAQSRGIGTGETIELGAAGVTTTAKVTGIYVEGSNEGQMLMMPRATAERVFGEVSYAELWLVLDEEAERASVVSAIRSASDGQLSLTDARAATVQEFELIGSTLRSVLYPLNAVLVLIAVANLLTALLFAVRERRRDYALLKAIGFTPGQVLLAVSSGAVVIAVLGGAVGAPVGYFVTSGLVNYFGTADGWPSGVAQTPSLLWIPGVIVLAVVIAVAGSWWPARQAASTGVSEALRYE